MRIWEDYVECCCILCPFLVTVVNDAVVYRCCVVWLVIPDLVLEFIEQSPKTVVVLIEIDGKA